MPYLCVVQEGLDDFVAHFRGLFFLIALEHVDCLCQWCRLHLVVGVWIDYSRRAL